MPEAMMNELGKSEQRVAGKASLTRTVGGKPR